MGEGTGSVHTTACSLLGKGSTRLSVGDPHRRHGADRAVGSSSQDLANPALGWAKGWVRYRDNGLQNIPTWNKGREAFMALGKHVCITDGAKGAHS